MMYERCDIFTPYEIVLELLDKVGYITNLYGKKILENSCGDGQILSVIVERYILDCLKHGISVVYIKEGLQRDIYGAEINEQHYLTCIENLNLIAAKYRIYNVSWNIFNEDILRKRLDIRFDYVVGNPPYIKYKDIDNETRIFLKNNYEVCEHGKFDYCYAFIEFGLRNLNEKGILSYLIPNSIFKNVFAQKLRDMILPSLTNIYDYTIKNIFEKALTSSAILVCRNGTEASHIKYKDIANNTEYQISKKGLIGKWVFSNLTEKSRPKKRFGDYFTAAISIATLFNEAYILKDFVEEDKYIVAGDYEIERDIIREGVSPRSLNYNKKYYIIFPYKYNNNTLVRFTRDEFEDMFPKASDYLKIYSKKLAERKSDKGIEWFEYGRSQALTHLNQPKLLLSTVVTKEVKVYELTKECIPFSGIYIVPKKDQSLQKAKKILDSDDFYQYVKRIGINASGSSLRITAVDINNYKFCEEEI